jgi:NAD-dependent SIR2 family protein deacetylase
VRVTDESNLASPNTLVLLGAGASVGAGFPTSLSLHEQLLERLDPIYRNLADLVFPGASEVDPERLFRVIQFLGVLESPQRVVDEALGYEAADVAALVAHWQPAIEEFLGSQLYRVSGSAVARLIDQLWRTLQDIFTMKDPPVDPKFDYLADLASRMRGQTIVTLNYDDTLEHMPGRAFTFRIDSAPFPELGHFADVNVLTRPLRLVKLHGSLDWCQSRTSGNVEVAGHGVSFWRNDANWAHSTPGIIFGAGNKLRPNGPYLSLYHEFKNALRQAHQVIVIGYSFRDTHVNEALRCWVQEQSHEGDLLRIGRRTSGIPDVVKLWLSGERLDVEVVHGPAQDNISALLKPVPGLRRPSPLT